MKTLLFICFFGLILSIQARANSCTPKGPSKECMEYVYVDAGYNKVKAAELCSGEK